jgi:hypothetical protein
MTGWKMRGKVEKALREADIETLRELVPTLIETFCQQHFRELHDTKCEVKHCWCRENPPG